MWIQRDLMKTYGNMMIEWDLIRRSEDWTEDVTNQSDDMTNKHVDLTKEHENFTSPQKKVVPQVIE